ncbi:cytochrome c biogenesis protein CcsA [Kosmotoga pacifica]|uniref:Heme exporter protein C n=1 Tax=Kosmotoga pacifica TaxID=1330330 RepID=A0A0G2ZC32_9BACT|nr:cytochrome c biogenesis protein CcsA [Kosmotoga pacifica]AKI97641.1 hypothetical protein IX53_07230 [Kosmotoga pacifica]
MSDVAFFSIGFILYLISALFLLFASLTKKEKIGDFAMLVGFIGSLMQLPGFIIRGIAISFIPLTNTFEAVTFFAFAIMFISFFFFMKREGMIFVKLIVVLFVVALAAIASSPLAPSEARPPVPALQSYWLILHISFAFIGEVFFAIAFATGLVYLLSKNEKTREKMDGITYRAIAAGFPLYTLGALIFGAIWAKYAWGRYWSWDPKETWSLIGWFVYAGYLHARLMFNWKGKRSAWLAVIGFLVLIFTFFGVNYLIPGLHSYTG